MDDDPLTDAQVDAFLEGYVSTDPEQLARIKAKYEAAAKRQEETRMRTDETGAQCPATLGEYRDLVFALMGDVENPTVKMLDAKIAEQGRDERVVASDLQMRVVLFDLMAQGLKTRTP